MRWSTLRKRCETDIELSWERSHGGLDVTVTSHVTYVNGSTRLTKTARETLSVPHVGMPAKR